MKTSFFGINVLITIIMICCATILEAYSGPGDIVGHWNVESIQGDNIYDMSCNSNHGRIYNAVKGEEGLIFDNVEDSVIIEDNETLALTGSLSIEAFVSISEYPPETQGHAFILFRGDEQPGRDPYFLAIEPSGKARFHIESAYTTTWNFDDIYSETLPKDTLLHIVGTLDDETGEMKLYIDGKLVSRMTTDKRPFADLDPTKNGAVAIGNHPSNDNPKYRFPFHGAIRAVTLYARALTAESVANSYEQGPAMHMCRNHQLGIPVPTPFGGEVDNEQLVVRFVETDQSSYRDIYYTVCDDTAGCTLDENNQLLYDEGTGIELDLSQGNQAIVYRAKPKDEYAGSYEESTVGKALYRYAPAEIKKSKMQELSITRRHSGVPSHFLTLFHRPVRGEQYIDLTGRKVRIVEVRPATGILIKK